LELKNLLCISWFNIASEEIELNANPFNPFFMTGHVINGLSANKMMRG